MRKFQHWITLLTAIVTITFILSEHAMAKDDDSNTLKWALSFGIRENFTLGSFDGQGISLRRQLSENSGMRLSEYFWISGDNTDSYRALNRISLLYIRIIHPNQKIRFFWGVGPSYEYDYRINTSSSKHVEDINKLWSIGLRGVFGVEYFIIDQISIHAEYLSIAQYSRHTNILNWADAGMEDTESSHGYFKMGIGEGVLFGVSVYF